MLANRRKLLKEMDRLIATVGKLYGEYAQVGFDLREPIAIVSHRQDAADQGRLRLGDEKRL